MSQGKTYVPDPSKADGKIGTGSNVDQFVSTKQVPTAYVPDPSKADGRGVEE